MKKKIVTITINCFEDEEGCDVGLEIEVGDREVSNVEMAELLQNVISQIMTTKIEKVSGTSH